MPDAEGIGIVRVTVGWAACDSASLGEGQEGSALAQALIAISASNTPKIGKHFFIENRVASLKNSEALYSPELMSLG